MAVGAVIAVSIMADLDLNLIASSGSSTRNVTLPGDSSILADGEEKGTGGGKRKKTGLKIGQPPHAGWQAGRRRGQMCAVCEMI